MIRIPLIIRYCDTCPGIKICSRSTSAGTSPLLKTLHSVKHNLNSEEAGKWKAGTSLFLKTLHSVKHNLNSEEAGEVEGRQNVELALVLAPNHLVWCRRHGRHWRDARGGCGIPSLLTE